MFFLSDAVPQVKAFAIHTIADLLEIFEPKTIEESLVFIDYLLPELVNF